MVKTNLNLVRRLVSRLFRLYMSAAIKTKVSVVVCDKTKHFVKLVIMVVLLILKIMIVISLLYLSYVGL